MTQLIKIITSLLKKPFTGPDTKYRVGVRYKTPPSSSTVNNNKQTEKAYPHSLGDFNSKIDAENLANVEGRNIQVKSISIIEINENKGSIIKKVK